MLGKLSTTGQHSQPLNTVCHLPLYERGQLLSFDVFALPIYLLYLLGSCTSLFLCINTGRLISCHNSFKCQETHNAALIHTYEIALKTKWDSKVFLRIRKGFFWGGVMNSNKEVKGYRSRSRAPEESNGVQQSGTEKRQQFRKSPQRHIQQLQDYDQTTVNPVNPTHT